MTYTEISPSNKTVSLFCGRAVDTGITTRFKRSGSNSYSSVRDAITQGKECLK